MPSLASQLRKIRWVAVPVIAYLVITLGLPAANGAGARPDFVRHASIVLAACIAAIAVLLAFNTVIDIVRRRS